ncbi:cytochrome c oxidase subunit II [Halorussus salilacus]|uniref:cytochrome c oxidase subunit II n=1 Tax=Halorussus salilacus TaxID=2953750 RepID=UPI00209C87C4|nr:cytochrome c oxidase subunit II [Halorussus salilacus]USZ69429.1 cytochrome c oxidase subunit II [Halorussus salilacus]
MEIHAYEKLWLGAALLLIVGFIATVSYGAVGAGVEMIDDEGDTVDPDSLDDHPKFSDPGVYESGDGEYDVYVIAEQFRFAPGTNEPIEVPANSTLTFHVTSADVIHGFEVVGTNANTMAVPGQVATFTVEVDGPREYGLLCNEYCGSAHHAMEGTVKVVPEDEFDGPKGDD